jgi:hypothetical protein
MLFAKKKMVLVHVLVLPSFLEILTQTVDPNVLKTLIALEIKLVSTKNVETHVLESAEITLYVTS